MIELYYEQYLGHDAIKEYNEHTHYYVTRYEKIDHCNFFYEIHVFGIDRRRIYCRIEW